VPRERFASNLFILTGAPGSGKTAILRQLGNEFICIDEPAREILAEQRATGGRGTWEQDASLFVHLLLQRSIEKHEMARGSEGTVVFDRGIPDCVVYAVRAGIDPTPSLEAVEVYRYQPHVLFLEPWRDIYETDDERIMSFDDTVSFSRELRDRTVRLHARRHSPGLDRRSSSLRAHVRCSVRHDRHNRERRSGEVDLRSDRIDSLSWPRTPSTSGP
jgi:predicted ATPase